MNNSNEYFTVLYLLAFRLKDTLSIDIWAYKDMYINLFNNIYEPLTESSCLNLKVDDDTSNSIDGLSQGPQLQEDILAGLNYTITISGTIPYLRLTD